MVHELPSYQTPPVIETVLGVQFTPISSYSAAHAGRFWSEHLDRTWQMVKEAPRLEDQFELFREDDDFAEQGGIRISPPQSPRVQIIRKDQERMIQIQNSRFIYNWRKGGGAYPRYEALLPEMRECFSSFRRFCQESRLPDLVLNQWEITYVNHIPKHVLWTTPEDWPAVFPVWVLPQQSVPLSRIETAAADWRWVIGSNAGRLHVTLRHGRVRDTAQQVLVFQLTARGPIRGDMDFELGFNVGHEAIVRTFTAARRRPRGNLPHEAHEEMPRTGGRRAQPRPRLHPGSAGGSDRELAFGLGRGSPHCSLW